MPRLIQYVNRRPEGPWPEYYVRGCIPGQGYCTWQIGPDGLRHLRRVEDGRAISIREVEDLLRRNYIWTGGRGTTRGPVTPLGGWLGPLAARLIAWASGGDLDTLDGILPTPRERDACFTKAFLNWLRGLDPAGGWERMSAEEFAGLAVDRTDRLPDASIHRYCVSRGEIAVLWRLATVIGLVTATEGGGFKEPRLNAWLRGVLAAEPPPSNGPPVHRWLPPRIVWDVEDQAVAARLPSQTLPPGFIAARLVVHSETQRLTFHGGRSDELQSRGAIPYRAFPTTVELHAARTSAPGEYPRCGLWEFALPEGASVVLFHADGGLADADDPNPLPLGEYLALVAPGTTLAGRPGVRDLQPVEYGPAGWSKWAGFRFRAAAGIAFPGYRFAAAPSAVAWHFADAPNSAVRWLHPNPVYVCRWPTVRLESSEPLASGLLEVVTHGGAPRRVRVFVHPTDGGYMFDPNELPELTDVFGRVELRGRWGANGTPTPPLVLDRLPAMGIEDVSDERDGDASTAVRVTVRPPVEPPAAVGEATEATAAGGGEVVFRSRNPVGEPGVAFGDAAGGWRAHVALRANRIRRVDASGEYGAWQAPPLEIDPATVRLNDRVQIEFAEPPALEWEALVCRIDGGTTMLCGRPLGKSVRYGIDLHRWRDNADWRATGGTVAIRGRRGWIDVATLVAQPSPPDGLTQPLEPVPAWAEAESSLLAGLRTGEAALVAAAAGRCRKHAWDSSVGVREQLLALLAEAEASGAAGTLIGTEGAEEVQPDLLAAVALRRGVVAAPDTYGSFADLERVRYGPAGGRLATWVRAVAWYRFARTSGGAGGWNTVRAECRAHREVRGRNAFADADVAFLAELCALVRGDEPLPLVSGNCIWLEAVRAVGRFLRSPWFGAAVSDLPKLDDVPPPWFLHPADAEFLRFALAVAAGRSPQWPPRGAEFGIGLPLLRARWVRYGGGENPAGEYSVAYAAAVSAGCDWLIGVIIAERGKAP